MVDPNLWIEIVFLVICLLLSAFFSAADTAYLAASHSRLKAMASNGVKGASLALELQEQYNTILTAILVGNNLVNIAATAIATVMFTRVIGGSGPTLSTIVMTILVLIFGEVSPKTLAKQVPERFAIWSARPLRFFTAIFRPIDLLFAGLRKALSHVFKKTDDEEESYIEEELINIVDEAQNEGDIDAHESELIRSAIEFNDLDVADVLTPRVDIVSVEDTATFEEIAECFRSSGYSRLPIIHDDIDHVVGILHEKDFYAKRDAGCRNLEEMMVPPVYAPATLKSSKLLKLFQSSKSHMIIVLDEFGGTEGIVTMEDTLEELVGEIYDEHDDVAEENMIQEDGSLLVDASMQLEELLEELGVEDTYDADTVGGWAGEILERIPALGDTFVEQGIRCTVTEMDERRVMQVKIEKVDAEEQSAEGE